MTIDAVPLLLLPVVLTKPGTDASDATLILGTAVAARTTDRVEAGATRRAAYQHGELAAVAVADTAFVIHHVLVDDVETVFPGLAVVERSVGRGPEISVT
jgi:hypothetical protein